MTSSLDRRLENVHIANNIEVDSNGLEIVLDPTWVSNLNSHKKIWIRRKAINIDPNGGYQF